MGRTPENRLHPRVAHRLVVRSTGRDNPELETINLSAGGLFCTSPTFVAPMTRLALELVLPGVKNGGARVQGEAVVVRTEPPTPVPSREGGYRIALYFSRMDDDDRRALQDFLRSQPM